MKTLVLLLLTTACFAQKRTYTLGDLPQPPIDSTTGYTAYIGVVEVPGVSADQLYTRAKAFLSKAFVNASAVIDVDDKSGGLLTIKGLIMAPSETINKQAMRATLFGDEAGSPIYYRLPVQLRFKDGKYRYEISNIQVQMAGRIVDINASGKPREKKYDPKLKISEKIYNQAVAVQDMFNNFVNELKTAMNKPSGKEDF